MKKIAVFGCKTTTRFLLESLVGSLDISQLITISPNLGAKNKVADYCDLTDFASSLNIDTYQAKTYSLKDEEDIQQIVAMNIDLAFVVGWQRLIPTEILQSALIGIFGMHGSSMNLPQGRGRSPLNWSIIEDRKLFYTNLFKYDAGVDSGNILDTFLFSITPEDTAETMHFKNTLAMKYLVIKNSSKLLTNDFVLKRQEEMSPTYYPKRDPSDSLIDWGRDIFYLERHIRAVTRPFNGAYTFLNNNKVIFYQASIFETELVDFGYNVEPNGMVVEVFPNGKFLVRCQGGLLLVHDFTAPIEIHRSAQFNNGSETIHYFELNERGYYDLK